MINRPFIENQSAQSSGSEIKPDAQSLFTAINKRYYRGVKDLIEAGVDVVSPLSVEGDQNGWTPLFAAAFYNSYKIIDMLIEAMDDKVDVSQPLTTGKHAGWTPLFASIVSGLIHLSAKGVVRSLIKAMPPESLNLPVTTGEFEGWTPVFTAAYHNRQSVLEELFKAIPIDDSEKNKEDAFKLKSGKYKGWSPLFVALFFKHKYGKGSRYLSNYLIDALDISSFNDTDPLNKKQKINDYLQKEVENNLYTAVEEGYLDVTKQLLKQTIYFNSSILTKAHQIAKDHLHDDIAEYINNISQEHFSLGPRTVPDAQCLFTELNKKQIRYDKVLGLISAGVDVVSPLNVEGDQEGWTPIFVAAFRNTYRILDMLIATKKVDVTQPLTTGKYAGCTPLFASIVSKLGQSRRNVIQSLIKAMPPESLNLPMTTGEFEGWTPVFAAAYHNSQSALEELFEAIPIDDSEKNKEDAFKLTSGKYKGWSPLFVALFFNHKSSDSTHACLSSYLINTLDITSFNDTDPLNKKQKISDYLQKEIESNLYAAVERGYLDVTKVLFKRIIKSHDFREKQKLVPILTKAYQIATRDHQHDDMAQYINLISIEHCRFSQVLGELIDTVSQKPDSEPEQDSLSEKSHEKTFAPFTPYEISAGIDAKYLDIESVSDLPIAHGAQDEQRPAKKMRSLSFIQPGQAQHYQVPTRSKITINQGSSQLSFYTAKPEIDENQKVVFVMAGRGENALIPPAHDNVRIVLVMNQDQYARLNNNIMSEIDMLVIDKLSSSSHGEFNEHQLGLITARRIAAFQFAYYFSLTTFIMIDDNIQSLGLNPDIFKKKSTTEDIYKKLDEMINDSDCFSLNLQTLSHYKPNRTNIEGRLGSKFFVFDFKSIRECLLNANDIFYLFPPAKSADWWGEDYYMQMMLEKMANAINRHGYTTLDIADVGGFVRSQSHRNSTKKVAKKADIYIREDFRSYIIPSSSSLSGYVNDVHDIMCSLVAANIESQRKKTSRIDLIASHAAANGIESEWIADVNVYTQSSSINSLNDAIKHHASSIESLLMSHQRKALKAISDSSVQRGRIISCTGSGKTRMQVALAHLASHDKPIIIVTPTLELVSQTYRGFIESINEFNALNTSHKISCQHILKISSNQLDISVEDIKHDQRILQGKKILIFCLDSFIRFLDHTFKLEPQLLFLDEYHLASSGQLNTIVNHPSFNACRIIGLTATPPAHDIFTDTIFTYTLSQAVNDEIIVPLYTTFMPGQLSSLNDFLENIAENLRYYAHPGGGSLAENKGILIVKSTKMADKISSALSEAGVKAYRIHSNNPHHKSDLKEFKKSRSPCVAVAVNMLQVGYDDHGVNYTIVAKTPISETSLIQIAGRAVRMDHDYDLKVAYLFCFDETKINSLNKLDDELFYEIASHDFLKQQYDVDMYYRCQQITDLLKHVNHATSRAKMPNKHPSLMIKIDLAKQMNTLLIDTSSYIQKRIEIILNVDVDQLNLGLWKKLMKIEDDIFKTDDLDVISKKLGEYLSMIKKYFSSWEKVDGILNNPILRNPTTKKLGFFSHIDQVKPDSSRKKMRLMTWR